MTFAIVGFVFVTGLLVVLTLRNQNPAQQATSQEESITPATAAKLADRIADLEQEVRVHRALALQRSSSAHHAGDSGPSESDPSAEKDASPSNKLPHPEEESPEREQEKVQARFSHYEQELEQQPRDPRWADEMETRLRETEARMQQSHLKGTTLTKVDCRSSLCRAEFQHQTPRERELLMALLQVEGLPRVGALRDGDEDALRTVAYLAPKELPRMPSTPGE